MVIGITRALSRAKERLASYSIAASGVVGSVDRRMVADHRAGIVERPSFVLLVRSILVWGCVVSFVDNDYLCEATRERMTVLLAGKVRPAVAAVRAVGHCPTVSPL
jgi:hypothetical protein